MIVPGVRRPTGASRPATAGMQKAFSLPWIPSFNIYYFMGVDGISFPLLIC